MKEKQKQCSVEEWSEVFSRSLPINNETMTLGLDQEDKPGIYLTKDGELRIHLWLVHWEVVQEKKSVYDFIMMDIFLGQDTEPQLNPDNLTLFLKGLKLVFSDIPMNRELLPSDLMNHSLLKVTTLQKVTSSNNKIGTVAASLAFKSRLGKYLSQPVRK